MAKRGSRLHRRATTTKRKQDDREVRTEYNTTTQTTELEQATCPVPEDGTRLIVHHTQPDAQLVDRKMTGRNPDEHGTVRYLYFRTRGAYI